MRSETKLVVEGVHEFTSWATLNKGAPGASFLLSWCRNKGWRASRSAKTFSSRLVHTRFDDQPRSSMFTVINFPLTIVVHLVVVVVGLVSVTDMLSWPSLERRQRDCIFSPPGHVPTLACLILCSSDCEPGCDVLRRKTFVFVYCCMVQMFAHT